MIVEVYIVRLALQSRGLGVCMIMAALRPIKPPRSGRLQLLTRSNRALDDDEVEYAKRAFNDLDRSRTGSIDLAELPSL